MPQVVNTNLMSLNSQRHLNTTNLKLATAVERLTSGYRINSAKDDAAGLAIADRMTSQVRGMNVAIRNANDAISMSQVAEGALSKAGDSLQRMRELAVQARNATNSGGDRASMQKEFKELQSEISRVFNGTTFNGKAILGASAQNFEFQIGANTTSNDRITVSTLNMGSLSAITDVLKQASGDVGSYGIGGNGVGSASMTFIGGASTGSDGNPVYASIAGSAIDAVITRIDRALTVVNDTRATFGAVQNRFESVIGQLQINVENQTASRSRILDADFAAETAELTRTQILQQGGIAMLGQANQIPQGVMRLLG